MSIPVDNADRTAPIRVVLVDDSPLTLRLLQRGLAVFPDIAVVGAAADGEAALTLIEQTDPDVVCTDLHMPGLDGLCLVRRLMAYRPKPIIVVSSALGDASTGGADEVFELMRAGALEVTAKPRGGFEAGTSADYLALARRIRVLAGVSVFRRSGETEDRQQRLAAASSPVTRPDAQLPLAAAEEYTHPFKIVAIGASTGGPTALLEVLSRLPRTLSVPLVAVQHIADGFLPGLARWLGDSTSFKVEIAQAAQSPRPGVLYLAPNNRHLTLDDCDRFVLIDGPRIETGHRPSVDRLFESIASRHGRNALAILLTGMGRDGSDGMGAIVRAGGATIAQDQASCVVFGMPGAAIAAGHAQRVLPLAKIGPAIVEVLARRQAYLIATNKT